MNMKKIIVLLALLLSVLLMGMGCGTTSSASRVGEAPSGYITLNHDATTLRLSYLDQKDLYKLYSQSNNPFMNYKSGRLIVIDTSMQSDAPLRLELKDAQLTTPGGSRGPTPKEEVYDYWYSRLIHNYGTKSRFYKPHGTSGATEIGGSSEMTASIGFGYLGIHSNAYHNWSLKVTTEVIEESILPGELDVPAKSEIAGYILFDPVPGERKVEAQFTLPVYDQQGNLVHRFEFQFPI